LQEPSEEKSEFIQEVDTSILSIPTSTTANMVSNRRESSSQEQIMTSGPTTRPKRNRTRRLFTPSPPPRLGGEPKRKKVVALFKVKFTSDFLKEMSDDSFSKEPSTTPSMQNVLVGKKIPWAKEQPRQSHSVHSMSTALIPSSLPVKDIEYNKRRDHIFSFIAARKENRTGKTFVQPIQHQIYFRLIFFGSQPASTNNNNNNTPKH